MVGTGYYREGLRFMVVLGEVRIWGRFECQVWEWLYNGRMECGARG